MKLSLWTKGAGLVCICIEDDTRFTWGGLYIHLGIRSWEHWQWGYAYEWTHGPHRSFGIGPLLLICW
jgi:hypothetical protein